MALGGYQAELSVYLTELGVQRKAESFEIMSRRMVHEGKFSKLEFQIYGDIKSDPQTQIEATIQLRYVPIL